MNFTKDIHLETDELVLHATCVSQTDDDWYAINISNRKNDKSYNLAANRTLKNIGDVKISDDNSIIVAVEFDGYVAIWDRNQNTQEFDSNAIILNLGKPARNLRINPHGTLIEVSLSGQEEVKIGKNTDGIFSIEKQ